MGDFDFSYLFQDQQDPFLSMYQDPQGSIPNPITPLIQQPTGLDSDFMNMYGQLLSGMQSPVSPFDESDPGFQRYVELSKQPSGAEDLLKNYTQEREDIESKGPGFWRILAGSLAGMGTAIAGGGTGTAVNLANTIFNSPREAALSEWKAKGANITTRARQMENARNRELQALRYGIQAKTAGKRSEFSENIRRQQEARRIADEITSEEKAKKDAEDRENERSFRRNMSNQVFNMQKDMNEWRKQEHVEDDTDREEARKAADVAKAAKAQSLDQINKRLSAYASQHGIDTSNMTALDTAKILAFQKAKANPAFGDLLTEENGTYTINTPKYGADRERILRIYMDRIVQQYLRGEF